MAYNILKGDVQFVNSTTGTIESMVNDFQAQTIAGIKTFTNTTSGSAFYDTTYSAYLAPFATSLTNEASDRIMTSNGDGTLNCEANMTFDGSSLNIVGHVTASTFSGSGVGLTGIPADSFSGLISGDQIDYGNGLTSSAGTLSVTGSDGIAVGAAGVAVDLAANGGLNFSSEKLIINASTLTAIASPADADQLIIQDVAPSSAIKNITLSNLYSSYLANKLPVTAFTNNVENRLITVSSTTSAIEGEANLTFNSVTSVLDVNGVVSASGNISGSTFYGDGSGLFNIPSGTPAGADTQIQFNDGGSAFGASSNLTWDDTNFKVTGSVIITGDTTLGDASGDTVTINAATVDVPNVAVGVSNTVVLYDGSTMLKRNIGPKVWAGALVDYTGTPVANQVTTWSDGDTVEGSANFTFDGSTLSVDSATSPIIVATNTSSNAFGAVLDLINSRGGGAGQVDDFCGGVTFKGQNDGSAEIQYGKITTKISDPSAGVADGRMIFEVTTGGTSATTYMTLDGIQSAITASVDTRIDGNLNVSGSIRGKMLETTRHAFNNGSAAAVFIPFVQIVELASPDYRHQMVAPHDGRLVKALVRTKNAQSGNVTLELYVASDGTEDFTAGGTSVEQVTITHGGANITETYSLSGSDPFAAGDIVGIKISPNAAPGDVNITCIWEYYNL